MKNKRIHSATSSFASRSRVDFSLGAKNVKISKDLDTHPLYHIDDNGILVLFELPPQDKKDIKVIEKPAVESDNVSEDQGHKQKVKYERMTSKGSEPIHINEKSRTNSDLRMISLQGRSKSTLKADMQMSTLGRSGTLG